MLTEETFQSARAPIGAAEAAAAAAEIHLHRARLFRDKGELKRARALIELCGYWRRKQELEDAEEAAKAW